jgi:catalase
MRYQFTGATVPTYSPNSFGGPEPDVERAGEGGWQTDGELIRAAQTLHSEDDDFGQAATLYRDVFDDEAKTRIQQVLIGQYKTLTVDRVKERFIWYWTQVDANLGHTIASAVGAAS